MISSFTGSRVGSDPIWSFSLLHLDDFLINFSSGCQVHSLKTEEEGSRYIFLGSPVNHPPLRSRCQGKR